MINVHILQHICLFVSYVIKQMCEVCDKKISKEKYEKSRHYLIKMKELN